jgi:hypothetical protein
MTHARRHDAGYATKPHVNLGQHRHWMVDKRSGDYHAAPTVSDAQRDEVQGCDQAEQQEEMPPIGSRAPQRQPIQKTLPKRTTDEARNCSSRSSRIRGEDFPHPVALADDLRGGIGSHRNEDDRIARLEPLLKSIRPDSTRAVRGGCHAGGKGAVPASRHHEFLTLSASDPIRSLPHRPDGPKTDAEQHGGIGSRL